MTAGTRHLLILLVFFLTAHAVFADEIRIGLLSGCRSSSVIFIASGSSYRILSENKEILSLSRESSVKMETSGEKVRLTNNGKVLGSYRRLIFQGTDSSAYFRIRPSKGGTALPYREDLEVRVNGRILLCINCIGLENYVASVMESEIGSNVQPEFLKVQAILTRTFAQGNRQRHQRSGFSLCDGVHCQAYKSRNRFNYAIEEAVKATRGVVMQDKNGRIITAAYHSNCGGQTMPSQELWKGNDPCLQSVSDSFCVSGKHAAWRTAVYLPAWKDYLRRKWELKADTLGPGSYCFLQDNRLCCYTGAGMRVPLQKIRDDWKLRSTFFSIRSEGDSLVFVGHGYGHGVGLCQEGAMQMAALGYSCREILAFYYHEVRFSKDF